MWMGMKLLLFFSLFFVQHLCVSEHKLSYHTLKYQQTESNKTKTWLKFWLKITNYLLISFTNQLLNKALDIKVQWIQSQHLNCNKILFWFIKMKLLCWLYWERQKELSWNITSEIFRLLVVYCDLEDFRSSKSEVPLLYLFLFFLLLEMESGELKWFFDLSWNFLVSLSSLCYY